MLQKYAKAVSLILCAVLLSGYSQKAFADSPAAFAESGEQALEILVMSDPHILAPELVGDPETNADYANALASDRKMLSESASILDEAIEMAAARDPDVLIIPGDLTKDGELASHEYLAAKLNALRDRLPGLKILVTNGNHDINNVHAFDYSSGAAASAAGTSPGQYRALYAGLGFADGSHEYYAPTGGQAGGNSYVTRPAEGFTVISVDTCKYTSDVTPSGTDIQTTGGVITAGLLDWIVAKAAAAKAAGDEVIVFQHHGVIPHYSMQTAIASDYLLDNWEEVGAAYASAGIRFVFTGHGHAQSIVEAEYDGNTLYDIETNSLVTYPSPIRYVSLSKDGSGAGSLRIQSDCIEEIDYNGETISDFTEYGRAQVGADTLIPGLLGASGELVAGLIGEEGSLAAAEDLLLGGGNLSEQAMSLLSQSLGDSEETGTALPLDDYGLAGTLWHDATNNRLTITFSSGQAKAELYITAENIDEFLVRSCFSQLDEILGSGEYDLSGAIKGIADALGSYRLDETHDFYDLAAYAYQVNIDGSAGNGLEPWAQAAMERLAGHGAAGPMLEGFRAQLEAALLGTPEDGEDAKGLLELIEINYGDGSDGLFSYRGDDEVIAGIYPIIAEILPKDAAGLLRMALGDDIFGFELPGNGEESETLGDMLDDLIGGLVHDLLASFMLPYGALDNNNVAIEWGGAMPPPAFDGVTVSIEAAAESDISQPVEFAVSLTGARDVSVITLVLEADGNMLAADGFETLNGFAAMSEDIAWNYGGNGGNGENSGFIGRLTLVHTPYGENFTSADKAEILRLGFAAKQLGETSVRLVDAIIVEGVTDGSVEWKFGSDVAKTSIVDGVAYSPYDLNKDSFVDEKDLSIILGYYLFDSEDPEWEYAKAGDFGGTEGRIDITDILAVYANFSLA